MHAAIDGLAAYELQDETLVSRFEAQASRTPDAIALTFFGFSLTYRELDERANQLAHVLIERGVGPEVLVGISLEREPDAIVSMLAILKAGGAYLPLDPTHPPERLAFIAADAAPVHVITRSGLTAAPWTAPTLSLDDPTVQSMVARQSHARPTQMLRSRSLTSAHTAYVLYTSGSTGKPKGVAVTHRNVCELFNSTQTLFPFSSDHTWILFHGFGFDVSVWEIFGCLLYGGRLVIVNESTRVSPLSLIKVLEAEKVTVLCQTPSAFNVLLEELRDRTAELADLEYLTFIGEALDFNRLIPWYSKRTGNRPILINKYGPTETTVLDTWYQMDLDTLRTEKESIIGRPTPGSNIYVLDHHLEKTAVGVPGEIYIGGHGVTRGYLNRPGLTAERFIASPFGPPGGRMYRTGDLGCWRPDGTISFLGRVDRQVKIRGFRIECGEIEAALREVADVAQVAVTPRTLAGEPNLVAYFVPRAGTAAPTPLQMKEMLAEILPDYMVPAAFVELESLPLNVNGKLDWAALPDFEGSLARRSEDMRRPPSTPREQVLARLFGKVLGIDPPGVNESFFDLGGHSLQGLRLMHEIDRALGLRIPLGTLFNAPTVEMLALKLDESNAPSSARSIVTLGTETEGEPIFMIHWIERDLGRQLGKTRPVYGVSYGLAAVGEAAMPMPSSAEILVDHYLEEILKTQPKGPYRLLGHSSGGVLAFLLAQKLVDTGQKVAFLGLLDSQAPGVIYNRPKLPLATQLTNMMRASPQLLWRRAWQFVRRQVIRVSVKIPLLGEYFRSLHVDGRISDVLTDTALENHQLTPYSGRVDVFESTDPATTLRSAPLPPASQGWARYALGGLVGHAIVGDHLSIVKAPLAAATAAKIEAAMQAADGHGGKIRNRRLHALDKVDAG